MLKSGDRAGHPISPLRETRRPGKISPKTFIEFKFMGHHYSEGIKIQIEMQDPPQTAV
jgi:hypothetical protein